MKRFITIGLIAVLTAAVIAAGISFSGSLTGRPPVEDVLPDRRVSPRPASSRDQLEAELKRAGKLLLEASYAAPAGEAGRSIQFTPDTLRTHSLYFKHKSGDEFAFLGGSGRLRDERSVKGLTLTSHGEILLTQSGTWLFLDGIPYDRDLRGWTIYWVAAETAKPNIDTVFYQRREMADGFMRTKLLEDEAKWLVADGDWRLKKHGGGMPTTEAEMANYSFQRAVNPFSLIGRGILTYGRDDWLNGEAEARFYFGVPWTEGAVDCNTLPRQRTMMIAFGRADDRLVAFGWCGRERTFILVQRESDGEWKEIDRWHGGRPAISNWVRIGLRIRDGHIAEGFLDGEKAVTKVLDRRISGPFHVVGEGRDIELDDVAAWTVPKRQSKGRPIYVRSRNFEGKKLKGRADSVQFTEWAQGSDTFIKMIQRTDDYKKALIINRLPLMGDFFYETIPEHENGGELPFGLYELVVYANPQGESPAVADLKELTRLQLIRDEEGWQAAGDLLTSRGIELPLFALRLERKAVDGNNINLLAAGDKITLGRGVEEPVHLAIVRLLPLQGRPEFPSPYHHRIYSANLRNEFFEKSPSEWSWIEGGFRMDCRWACQERWNFMACGGVGVPMMVSKTEFSGDQYHEYYFSLRPMFPSDAGDPGFVYNQKKHRRFFGANHGWYVRRDLNFSFCMDGRNPMSGYAVVFGGDDNSETRLLRQGKIVARTKSYRLPDNLKIGNVHWKWWNFRVRKYGNRVVVRLNKSVLFDYTDPDPLTGGHIAFWTVRNGFTLSRVTSIARRLRRDAHVLYVKEDTAPLIWRPLLKDAVCMSRRPGRTHTEVAANVGAGFMAVRHTPPEPVELKQKPVMELPIELGPGAKVNLHLQVDESTYLIQLTGPLGDAKALLGHEFEKRVADFDEPVNQGLLRRIEQFRIPTMSEYSVKTGRLLATAVGGDVVRVNLVDLLRDRAHTGDFKLYSITVGNTSNTGYLLAGANGNQAGTGYVVGTPRFFEPGAE